MFHSFTPDGQNTYQINFANVAYVEFGREVSEDEDRSVTVHFIGGTPPLELSAMPGHASRLERVLSDLKGKGLAGT